MSKESIELNCRETCPFSRKCGQSYLELESPCVEAAYTLVEILRISLSHNPFLDTQKPWRKFSHLNLTAIEHINEIPIAVCFKSGLRPLTCIGIGEIKNGLADFHQYQEEIIRRIRKIERQSIVVKPQF